MTALPLTIADRLRAWHLRRSTTTCEFCARTIRTADVRTTLYVGRIRYICSPCLKGMRRIA